MESTFLPEYTSTLELVKRVKDRETEQSQTVTAYLMGDW